MDSFGDTNTSGGSGARPEFPLVTAQVDGKPLAAAWTAAVALDDVSEGLSISAPGREVSGPAGA